MRAKSFFNVTLGILALATAYHLGAQNVGAQSAASFVTGSFDVDTDPLVIDSGGNAWMMGWFHNPGVRIGPVHLPETSGVLAASVTVATYGGPDAFSGRVLYDNGNAYVHEYGSGWAFIGNVGGGATPAAAQSWGALKVKYR